MLFHNPLKHLEMHEAALLESLSLLQVPFCLSKGPTPWPRWVKAVNALQGRKNPQQELYATQPHTHLEQKSWGHVSSLRWSTSFHSAIDGCRESFHNNSRKRALVGSGSQGRKKSHWEKRIQNWTSKSTLEDPDPQPSYGFSGFSQDTSQQQKQPKGQQRQQWEGRIGDCSLSCLRLQKGRDELRFSGTIMPGISQWLWSQCNLFEPSWNRQLKCDHAAVRQDLPLSPKRTAVSLKREEAWIFRRNSQSPENRVGKANGKQGESS